MIEEGTKATTLAIIVPAYNAASTLGRVLSSIKRAAPSTELIVVDPASRDETAEIARRSGARVVLLPERQGPAGARNAGVAVTDADVILFVDSDCEIAEDVPSRVIKAFTDIEDLVGLTGSYDDTPPERNIASLYMNLRHHYTHHRARREPASFWAGLGAVRRQAFLAVGGFDSKRFPWPMIEDIELAGRLSRMGRLRLDPSLQAKHLKRWTVASVVRTDIFSRAVPWSRLILETGVLPDDLNLKLSQRLAALLAPLSLLSVVAAPLIAILSPWLSSIALLPILLSYLLNAGLFACFLENGGVALFVFGWFLHQLHLTYSAATFAICSVQHRLTKRRESAKR